MIMAWWCGVEGFGQRGENESESARSSFTHHRAQLSMCGSHSASDDFFYCRTHWAPLINTEGVAEVMEGKFLVCWIKPVKYLTFHERSFINRKNFTQWTNVATYSNVEKQQKKNITLLHTALVVSSKCLEDATVQFDLKQHVFSKNIHSRFIAGAACFSSVWQWRDKATYVYLLL